jgi:murein DD-endopeptidase MepM/ murein hydrolase activator NlpD
MMKPRMRAILWLSLIFWLAVPQATVLRAATGQPEEPVIHEVQSGETLFRIAEQYGTTVEAIVAANDISDPSLIRVGQELIIPGASGEVASEAEGSVPQPPALTSYLIVPGDTLEAVARRFEVTTTTLAKLNGAANPADLVAGGRLQVPQRDMGRVHRVSANETAAGLALRYGLSLWEFLAANELASPGALVPGQRVWVPSPVATDTLPLPYLGLDVGPTPVLQGNTVRVRVQVAPDTELLGVFDDQTLKFAVEEGQFFAMFGIHALADPGSYPLALLAVQADGDEVYLTRSVDVQAGDFGYEEIVLTEEQDSLLDPQALAAERARLAQIETVFNPERYWQGLFVRPIDTELTSFFGTRRTYMSPSYTSYGYHEGTDFNGEVGDAVHATAAGTVVLAEPLYVRGNAVVIDHGWGIYTGYWHLSEIGVTVGQEVMPGDQIGLVGSTGLSTGSHLHWDFWVNGTNVSALQWTEQLFP